MQKKKAAAQPKGKAAMHQSAEEYEIVTTTVVQKMKKVNNQHSIEY